MRTEQTCCADPLRIHFTLAGNGEGLNIFVELHGIYFETMSIAITSRDAGCLKLSLLFPFPVLRETSKQNLVQVSGE